MMLRTRVSAVIISLGLLTGMQSAYAGSGLVLEGGLHFGGDQLAEVFTSSGSESVDAGELYTLGIGVALDLAPDLESRITVGIKEDGVFADNGDVTFTRYPIDVLILRRTGNWKIGGGITYHLSPEFTASTVSTFDQAKFEDALGFLLELDRELGPAYIGGRLTFIEYDSIPTATVRSTSISGNSFGIVAGIRF